MNRYGFFKHRCVPAVFSAVLAASLFVAGCDIYGNRGGISADDSMAGMPLIEMELPEGPLEGKVRESYSTSVNTVILGRSVKGRAISMVVFGGENRPSVFIFGGIHGEEKTAAATAENLIEYLRKHPEFYSSRRVAVLPRANPDGLAVGRRFNEHGVDLNRNFPAHNFRTSDKHGTHPASEPETRAIIKAMNLLDPNRIISIHSCKRGRHGNNWDGPAWEIARSMSKHNHYSEFGTWHNATPGSFGNWAGVDRKIPVVTLELPNDLSASRCWSDNRDAILEFIKSAPTGK